MKVNKIHNIYMITNKLNKKIYIGQTSNISVRWSTHRKAVLDNNPSQVIHKAMIKYGIENFEFQIIASCQNQEDTNWTEEHLIKEYNSTNRDKGYNCSNGGATAPRTEEFKQKISEKLKGHPVSNETKNRIGNANRGKIMSEEQKQLLSSIKKGKPNPKKKMKQDRENGILEAYGRGDIISKIEEDFNTSRSSIYRILERNNIKRERPNDGWTGKTHSEETKNKMADARKAHWDEWASEKGIDFDTETKILECYKDNVLISDIENRFKVSKNRIYNLLKKHNINCDRI